LNSKEDSNVPRKLVNCKIKFKKVVAGLNFSIGLSMGNQLYFWGNYKYMCDPKILKDIDDPLLMKFFENQTIKDITVCYKQCVVLNDTGDIYVWGDFMQNKFKGDQTGKEEKHKGG
jgi:alpha-tubulin suppressor-like RCC1 family protein